jgi:protein TonB
VIVNDQPHQSAMPDITQLDSHAIGLQTTEGEGDINQSGMGGNGQGTIVNGTDSSENNVEIFEHPEVMPEFPGGPEGLKRYLQKNLRMPENNLEAGAQVKVIARFVVEADGRVRNVEITNDVEDLFSREVKRVILKMPEWKPGKQHNHNVAVYFSLPVNFVAEE